MPVRISAGQKEHGLTSQGHQDPEFPEEWVNLVVQVNVAAGNTRCSKMNRYYKILIITSLSIFLLHFPFSLLSQKESRNSLIKPDTSKSEGSPHSLFTGLGFGSSFIYLGSTISQDKPFGYTALTYGYREELFATISAVHLSNYSPFLAFYTGSISYTHVFNSWFDIALSFSRYQVAPSLADTLFDSFFYGDLTLGFDWKLIYTKISAGALFSDETMGYLQLRNSRYFQTPEFTKKKLFFSFDPYFTILLGPLAKVETTEGKTVTLSPPFKKGGKYGQTTSYTTISTKFGLMEMDFGVPVSFNSTNFTIEAEPGYIIPLYDDPVYPGLKGFVFMLSGYLRIF